MDFKEFLAFHAQESINHSVFEVDFEDNYSISASLIEDFERKFDVRLPENFKEFCLHFHINRFGYVLILSPNEESDYFIGEAWDIDPRFKEDEFIPFSDDQTGGYYCFKSGNEDNPIFYIDEIWDIEETDYKDFFDFIIRKAYIV